MRESDMFWLKLELKSATLIFTVNVIRLALVTAIIAGTSYLTGVSWWVITLALLGISFIARFIYFIRM